MFQGKPMPVFETNTFTKTSKEQKQWLQRIKDLHKIAKECDQTSKEITIQRLNNPKRATVTLAPGDRVLAFVPVQAQKGETLGKRNI